MAEFLETDHIQRALATRSAFYVFKVANMLTDSKAPTKTKQNELFAMEVNKMTRMHLIYIMYERARSNLYSRNMKCANLKKIMMSALANFALKQLSLDFSALYDSGFFGIGSSDLLESAYKQTLIDLRPQIVSLAELVPEASIPSTIGNYYGDIYEN